MLSVIYAFALTFCFALVVAFVEWQLGMRRMSVIAAVGLLLVCVAAGLDFADYYANTDPALYSAGFFLGVELSLGVALFGIGVSWFLYKARKAG